MKFENRGKWLKESEEKLNFDQREKTDFLNGDDEVLTFESEDELLDEVEGEDFEEINKAEPADNVDEPAQKNEAFGPEDIVPVAKQMEFKKQYLQGKDARKVNKNSFYFDNVYAVDDNTGSSIPGAKLGMKYKDLAAALDKFFGESAQKNEAKLDRAYDINFDKLGCGFEVVSGSITNGYGLYCSGYSNNSGKDLMFSHKELSMDSGLTQEERRKHYDALQKERLAIAKDLKPIADKFDKDVEAIFAKHGFKPYKD